MSILSIYNTVVGLHPRIEVFFRKIYWKNINYTLKFKPVNGSAKTNQILMDFDKIIENLRNRGIGNGSIIIVHSSYDILKRSGLSPKEINSKLLELVGPEGTLVMPAIRKYKEEGKIQEYLTKSVDDMVCTYNVQRSNVISGFLPFVLMQRPDSYISRFPLNPVVAVGKHAKQMIEHNLEGSYPTPHGPHSSWKYCVDNNAIVICLGLEMAHFLTITHVNEECSADWPIKDWYRKRQFEIIDKEFKINKEVFERKPIWGTIYLAEKKYKKDLLKNGIIKIENVEGLNIGVVDSKQLINFLQARSHNGYPYFVGSRFMKKNSVEK